MKAQIRLFLEGFSVSLILCAQWAVTFFVFVYPIGARGFEDRDRMFFYITRFDLGDACGPEKTWLSVVEGDLTIDPRPISGKSVNGKY